MTGTVVTFYSYKGGVGRTLALANTAAILSRWGTEFCAWTGISTPLASDSICSHSTVNRMDAAWYTSSTNSPVAPARTRATTPAP